MFKISLKRNYYMLTCYYYDYIEFYHKKNKQKKKVNVRVNKILHLCIHSFTEKACLSSVVFVYFPYNVNAIHYI